MAGDMGGPAGQRRLHPYLPAGRADILAALDRAQHLIVRRAAEIDSLRAEVLSDNAERLLSCASIMAVRLAAGNRLLTFGTGAAAAEAQHLAALFLDPAAGVTFQPPVRTAAPTDRATPAADRLTKAAGSLTKAAGSLTKAAGSLTEAAGGMALPAINLSPVIGPIPAGPDDTGAEQDDTGAEQVAHRLATLAGPDDIALGVTVGDGARLGPAFAAARRLGLLTVGFVGRRGSALLEAGLLDHCFAVRSASVHRTEEAQAALGHLLWELVHAELNSKRPT